MEPLGEKEKKRLNQLGQSILREDGLVLEEEVDYDRMRLMKFKGYAEYYLSQYWNDSTKINEADLSTYRQLVDIDSKLGTNASLQLSGCLHWTTRWDLIKV